MVAKWYKNPAFANVAGDGINIPLVQQLLPRRKGQKNAEVEATVALLSAVSRRSVAWRAARARPKLSPSFGFDSMRS